jgi:hypothetical protein
MKRRESGGNTLPDADEDRLLRAARDRVRSAYPNPGRAGCPGRKRLEALARDECRPADEVDDLKHVVTCSPCFAEYDAIRTGWRRRRSRTLAGVAATAVAVMVSIGVFFLNHRTAVIHAPPATTTAEVARGETRKQVLDLRPFETFRGVTPSEHQPLPAPPTLERANLLLTVQLPIGSYEGRYLFTVVDSDQKARLETPATAVMKDHVTTAEVQADLRSLPPGRFTLQVRRDGAFATTSYPIEVR